MGRAEHVGVGGVGLLGGHLVGETGALHELGHLGAAAELVDESGVEPGLVDLQAGVDEQAVAIEALDVVALEGGAVAPDVDVVFLHRRDQHRAGDRAADGGGVEVGDAGGGDVERAGLQRSDAFADERAAAVDEARLFGAVLEGLARDVVVVGLVGLAEVRGIGVGEGALLLHPVQRGGGVEPAGEGDADFLADGQGFENYRHAWGTSESVSLVRSCPKWLGAKSGLLNWPALFEAGPPRSRSIKAFCACMRFSAWSKTTDCGPSSTASVTSALRCAGRQCMKTASGEAWAMRASLTW